MTPEEQTRQAIIAELQRRMAVQEATAPEPIQDTEPEPEYSMQEVLRGLLNGLRPEPAMTVTEWADTFRILGPLSAEPGKYRSARAPYIRAVMDALSPSFTFTKIVVMKGAQTFFSDAGYNWIGFSIHNAPGPILIVNPTEADMMQNSKTRIGPMIEDTPVLAQRVAEAKSRSTENSILYKKFPGGVLRMIGANAASGLRSMAARNIMLDEIDGYPDDVQGEGDPIDLAIKRSDTFGGKAKIYILSTPTNADSKIAAEFAKTDQRHFHVPCPHCGDFEPIVWDNMRWSKQGETYTAWLICTACGAEIHEHHKTWMLAHGQWVAHAPEKASAHTIGFHISGLYSPIGMFSWAAAAKQYVEAYEVTNETRKKKTFRNLVLGLTYEEDQDRPEWQALIERGGLYTRNSLPEFTPEAAPGKPLFLTCGVDVQRDRIELEIVAWGMAKESWSVDYRVIFGNTSSSDSAIWFQLEAVLKETWRVSGITMPIAWTGIDSSDQSTIVYAVVDNLNNRGVRILSVKGRAEQLAPLVKGGQPQVSTTGQKIGRPVYLVGVSMLKSELYGFLRLQLDTDGTAPGGYCHFPDYGGEYYKSLTAEAIIIETDKSGHPKQKWVKIYPRNEALDCRNYARAVASFNGIIDFDERKFNNFRGNLAALAMQAADKQAAPAKPKKPKSPKAGSIWDW